MPRGKRSASTSPSRRRGKSSSSTTSAALIVGGRGSLPSSSPKKSRKTNVCSVKRGKVVCQSVERPARGLTGRAAKLQAKKMTKCQMAEQLGVGVCDEEGDLWNFEDEGVPDMHEVAEDGSIVKVRIIDPISVAIFRSKEQREKFDAWRRENPTEVRRVDPEKLKKAYIRSHEEIKRGRQFLMYLVCLATKDKMPSNSPFAGLAGDVQSFSRKMLEFEILQKVLGALQRSASTGQDVTVGGRTYTIFDRDGSVSLDARTRLWTDEDLYFRKATWQYGTGPDEEVTVNLPPALSDALYETLLMNRLLNAPDSQEVGAWLSQLLESGVLEGSALSDNLITMILSYTVLTPGQLGMSGSHCRSLLSRMDESRRLNVSPGGLATLTTKSGDRMPVDIEGAGGSRAVIALRREAEEPSRASGRVVRSAGERLAGGEFEESGGARIEPGLAAVPTGGATTTGPTTA